MDCRVVIYGASLFMAVVESVLKEQPGFTLIRIDPAQDNALESASILNPEVILVEGTKSTLGAKTGWPLLATQRSETAVIVLVLDTFVLQGQGAQVHPIQNVNELVELVRLDRALVT